MPSDKAQLFNGVVWNMVQKYSGLVVSTIVSMILARLLSPEEFGIIAIATVIISFLGMLADMGIGPAIIQRRDFDDKDINNVFTISCIVGLTLSLLFFGSSWLLASLYHLPKLRPVCQILTINVLFAALNMVPNALMVKNMRFKQIAIRTLLLQVISGIISVIVAIRGGGVYSLLISPVFTAVGIFFYNRFYYKVKLSSHFSITPVKKIYSYSVFQFLFQIVTFFAGNVDKLIMGRAINASSLGYYQKAYQLAQLPTSNISSVIVPVLQPVLSKYQDEKRTLAQKYNRIIRLMTTICFPIGLLMFFSGPEIIHFFYGYKWDAAIPAFRIMTIAMPISVILSSSGSFFQSGNETRYLFILGLVNSFFAIAAMAMACLLFKTIKAVAYAWSTSIFFNLFTTYYFMYVKVLKDSIFPAVKELSHPVTISLFLAILLYAENFFLGDHTIINFTLKCLTTTLIALLALQFDVGINVIGILKEKCSSIMKNNNKT